MRLLRLLRQTLEKSRLRAPVEATAGYVPAMTARLDWYGCATFRLKVAGLTIFLDAYIDRAPGAAGSGLTADDIDECDWIVVGHSHFDHLWGAERIAANTAATVIGSYETVRVMEAAGVAADRMICVAGGETVDLGNGVLLDVFPSQHSCVWSQRQMLQSGDVCIGDLGVTWQGQQQKMRELQSFLATSLAADSLKHLLSSLAEFVAREVAMLRPRRVVLCHHDDWLPGFSVPTDLAPIRAALVEHAPGVELLEPAYLAATEIF